MWKKEDAKPLGVPEHSSSPSAPPLSPSVGQTTGSHRDASVASPVSSRAAACISQGIRIKGEITGSEDLFIDGPVEGKLNLTNSSLTVGPNGTVKADVVAREVIVRGRLEGKIQGRERDTEPAGLRRGVAEGRAQHVSLPGWQLRQILEQRPDKLMKPGEGKVRLGPGS